MSEQSNVPARLREGIDAAKRGDKITARRLLQQVLSVDGDNELALMWMASVVDSLNERRFFLERALSINPKNDRAREALRRLGVTEPETRRSPAAIPATDYVRQTNRNNTNIYLVAAAVVGFIVVAVIVASVVSSLQPQPTPIVPQNAQLTFQAILDPTSTATVGLHPPTQTLIPGIIVTLDSALLTPLPPTFTPTSTVTPLPTGLPTATPLPLKSFSMIYSDTEQGAAQPSLYQGNADGSGEIKLQSADAGGFLEIAYDPTGQRLAFVRVVDDGAGNVTPQLFVAPFDALTSPTQITKLTGSTLAHPSWSPDGTKIVFATNDNSSGSSVSTEESGVGTEQIAIINPDGTGYQALTTNTGRNYDPSFSPDGKLIAFASDMDSPGFTEIYTMTINGGNITALTNVPNSYSPVYSPDGTKIAFVNDQQGDGDIYEMDADGERPVLLTVDDNGAEDHSPAWTPDSEWIIFASNRDGSDQFRWYAVNMQGVAQPVTVTGRSPQSLSFITH